MSKKQKKQPRPVERLDGRTALKRTAELTRRIVQVPKSESPTDVRNQREPRTT